SAASVSLPASITRLTSPIRCASSAETMSPVKSISIACLVATLRESATIGVEQNRPMFTPGVQNLAFFEAIARSQLATSSQAAARRSEAVPGGDDRLGQRDDRLHHAAAPSQGLLEIAPPAVTIAAAGGELLEVVARAEHRTVGREHDGTHGAIGRDVRERFGK